MKTKSLIAAVALGDLAGQVITFIGGLANTTGWDVVKFPCECAWAVLAFPLGWVGLITGGLIAVRWSLTYPYLFLWVGVTMNGCLWAWVVFKVVRSMRGQAGNHGFDASMLSPRLAELRQSLAVGAHSRREPRYRRGLIGAASRAISRCGYFLHRRPEGRQLADEETHKNVS